MTSWGSQSEGWSQVGNALDYHIWRPHRWNEEHDKKRRGVFVPRGSITNVGEELLSDSLGVNSLIRTDSALEVLHQDHTCAVDYKPAVVRDWCQWSPLRAVRNGSDVSTCGLDSAIWNIRPLAIPRDIQHLIILKYVASITRVESGSAGRRLVTEQANDRRLYIERMNIEILSNSKDKQYFNKQNLLRSLAASWQSLRMGRLS